ncbi:MAG: DUF3349 domain-containing protein [Nocardioides sp.]|uniref:DUF3349 domain-containing protein n=1 Tax=Nocardioides sp. TaxID=35761 RepID=UPI0039E225FC
MTNPVGRMLEWLKAGYPDGVPPSDYPPVLGVLRRRLTDAEIEAIADDLALASVSQGVQAVTADDVHRMVRDHAFQSATDEDLRRVSAMLALGGWPLDDDLDGP